MQRRSLGLYALGAVAATGWRRAAGQPALRTATIAVGGAFSSFDPHFHNLTPNSAVTQHVFGRLAVPDADLRPQPDLALTWTAVSPTEWEFKLRPGTSFSDGSPFTADDVALTFGRVPNVPNSPGSYATYTKPVQQVAAVDPLTVRMATAAPAPLVPAFMAALPMIGRKFGQGATTADYNSGKAAVGTGPYRLVSFVPGQDCLLRRNEAYWGEREPWDEVRIRLVANDAARLAALEAGDVDLIDQVPTRDAKTLMENPKVSVFSKPGVRNIYLYLDLARRSSPFVTDLAGAVLPDNPLRDLRVRRALSLAINRDAIVGRVMDGLAAASGQFLPAGTMGYDPAIHPDPYDPERARALLAEAGHAQGFAVTLHGPNDRYVNDGRIIQAVAQMWTRIGVRTAVDAMPSATYFTRSARDEFSIGLSGWGTGTGEADSPLTALVCTRDDRRGRGLQNRSGYSNPEVDRLTDQALATLDVREREALYRRATAIGMADVAIVPLHHQVNIWATRRGLTYAARNDERTMAMGLR